MSGETLLLGDGSLNTIAEGLWNEVEAELDKGDIATPGGTLDDLTRLAQNQAATKDYLTGLFASFEEETPSQSGDYDATADITAVEGVVDEYVRVIESNRDYIKNQPEGQRRGMLKVYGIIADAFLYWRATRGSFPILSENGERTLQDIMNVFAESTKRTTQSLAYDESREKLLAKGDASLVKRLLKDDKIVYEALYEISLEKYYRQITNLRTLLTSNINPYKSDFLEDHQ